jgi:hypothetical protein
VTPVLALSALPFCHAAIQQFVVLCQDAWAAIQQLIFFAAKFFDCEHRKCTFFAMPLIADTLNEN